MSISLVHNTAKVLAPGKYQYRANVGTGAVTVEIGDGEGGFQNMTDGAFSADGDGTMTITDMPIRVQLTGTAEFRLSPLPKGS